MRLRLTAVLATTLAVFGLLASIQTGAASDDQGKLSTYISAGSAVGSTKLNAGDYDIKVDGSNATFSSNGRVVAQAPVQWKDASAKAATSSLDYDSGKVVGIHFKGKTRFAEVSQ